MLYVPNESPSQSTLQKNHQQLFSKYQRSTYRTHRSTHCCAYHCYKGLLGRTMSRRIRTPRKKRRKKYAPNRVAMKTPNTMGFVLEREYVTVDWDSGVRSESERQGEVQRDRPLRGYSWTSLAGTLRFIDAGSQLEVRGRKQRRAYRATTDATVFRTS